MGVLIASTLVVTLSAGLSTAARAAETDVPAPDTIVGDFGLGDGLEGGIDEHWGSFAFGVSAGGVPLSWDSARVGSDRYGLGDGWSWRTAFIDTDGGIRVFPANGGVFEADASSASGLLDYPAADLVFEHRPGGRLPARGDGGAGDTDDQRDFAYLLRELGGVTTFFDDSGDPVARITATGGRTDWRWSAEAQHRLVGLITPDGVRTELDWRDDGQAIRVRPASNVAGRGDDPATAWRVELHDGRIADVIDPLGGRVSATTDTSGLVTALESQSGAITELRWRARDDGSAQVEQVGLVDASAELSTRRFRPAASARSGWPLHSTAASAFGAGPATFTTEVSDGRTRVFSTTNTLGLLVSRRVVAATASGDRTLHEQRFAYPGTDEHGSPTVGGSAMPPAWSSPTSATVTHHHASGATRTSLQTTAFDEFGRPIEVVAADGTRTITEYDREPAPSVWSTQPAAPIGLPLMRRTIAPDGWTGETRYELNAARTGAVVVEQFSAAPGEALRRVARAEYTIEPDGFVSERRVYPNGERALGPSIARWHEQREVAAGTATVTAVSAADTPVATTTTSVISLVHGAVLQTTDEIGRTASVEYDQLGRVRRAADAAGRTTTIGYETTQRDGRNSVTTISPDGVAATEVLDSLGRITQVTDNVHDGVVERGFTRVLESRAYPDPATVVLTDPWGAMTTMRQDVYGRTVETIGHDGLRRLAEHDDVAMTVSSGVTPTTSLADAEIVTTAQRDESGRLVHTTSARADGGPTVEARVAYDGLGRVAASDDGVIGSTTEYDRFGNPARTSVSAVDGSAGVIAESRFDGFGASLEKTLGAGASLSADADAGAGVGGGAGAAAAGGEAAPRSGGSRELDPLGRPITLRDQLGRPTVVSYTADGLPETVTGPAGERTAYRYDPRTRQVTEAIATTASGGRVAAAYTYDEATGLLSAVFDPADTSRTRITYEHDADGRLTRTGYPDGRELTHDYDANGRKIASTDTAGHVTVFDYDRVGRVASVRQFEHDDRTGLLAEVRYRYDAYGRLAAIERGNGVRTEVQHDSAGLVAGEHTSSGGTPISDRDYAYDVHGNLTRRTDTVHASGTPTTTTTAYRYDALDRLTGSTVLLGDSVDAAVERRTVYDVTASADVASETVTEHPGRVDESITSRTYSYDALGELTELAVTRDGATERHEQQYDEVGNLVRRHDGTEYAYDAANRVVRETTDDGTVIATDYWADGARRQRSITKAGPAATDPPPATTYYWDGGTLVNEAHTGSPSAGDRGTASYLLGLQRESRTSVPDDGAPETDYSITDRHGSLTELTGHDGAMTAHYEYSDYGIQTGPRWPATDAASRAPDGASPAADAASPAAGIGDLADHAFLFAGELTDGDGTQYLRARQYDPVTKRFLTKDRAERQNLYHFADANPIVHVDPSGREPKVDFGLAMTGLALSAGALVATPFTGGSTLALFGAVAAAVFDTAVAAVTVTDQYGPDIIPDDWAFGLAVTATVVGFGALAVSLGHVVASRAANRMGTNATERLSIRPPDGAPPTVAVKPTSIVADELIPTPPIHPSARPTSTYFDTPPALTRENLERPQTVFAEPLASSPSEQVFASSHRKKRSISSPAAPVQRREAARPTGSTLHHAIIEEPPYVVQPASGAETVPIEHPLTPPEELLPPRSRATSSTSMPGPVADPSSPLVVGPVVVQPAGSSDGGIFSTFFDLVSSTFSTPAGAGARVGTGASGPAVPGGALYAKYGVF
jgi:RHS repeat-associated protein